ncbi:hypothetical protein [Bacillus paranthracis]|uniref:hypothetical protein n=1 Tax=Bacillus paranthracis TaxID=2026186 RepID=UPI00077828C4|nr:hypothetical protein [Bacillus paranthracis]KXY07443.1 hypothetical protein AT271_06420 [Bacillus cereus]MCC2437279.1 hypothetical protein [Bacillus paranthracis]MDG1605816.1 hypothetical protein [Bacillus paranthracis]
MALGWEHALTLVGAFASAGTAQYLSHRLTLNREDEKYQKERYQNFYAPLVFKIKNYVIAEAYKLEKVLITLGRIPKRKDDFILFTFSSLPDSNSILPEIISTIEKNLKYADLQFIEMYEKHKMHEVQAKDDEAPTITAVRWFSRLTDNLLVCEKFLMEYLSFSENISVLSNEIKKEIRQVLTSIRLYNLMFKFEFPSTARLLFSCTGNYKDVFIAFPDIHEKINIVKQKVNSDIALMIKSTGKDDIYCYEELIDLVRSIQNHINKYENQWDVFRYSAALDEEINADILNKKLLIQQNS